MYSVWTYFLARTSIEIVPTFLCSFGLALICFWMIGQRSKREGMRTNQTGTDCLM